LSFSRVLIANRGEIAVRIIRSVRALGYRSVAVFSEADAGAPHVSLADQAVCIGPPPSRESYLAIERIIEAAQRSGADAIHPGYGFLAENAQLAARCVEAGLTFIGPPADAIRLMGDKAEAKRRMEQAGVPVIPGYWGGEQKEQALVREAERIGFPLLVKAAAGGGGRGMRVVRELAQLPSLLASARAEAESSFGDGDLLLERLLERSRHVEIQVFADTHGNAIHLGERECSAQRRHQKIIEESPSPVVDEELRGRMGEAAVAAARAIGYVNAGTVEFMLGPDREFYFLEMNTRLQVEHPVTELVTGQDLVAWQLRVADGEPLPLTQPEVSLRGHAIEARIYAEDPYAGFLPQTGRILHWRPGDRDDPGVRVDSGIEEGQEISSHYDPMLAKVIACGETRELARRRLIAAIEDNALLGVTTNRSFLVDLLRDELFVRGEVTTSTIDQRFGEDPPRRPSPSLAIRALAAVICSRPQPPRHLPDWRASGEATWPVLLEHEGRPLALRVTSIGEGGYRVEAGEAQAEVQVHEDADSDDGRMRCAIDGIVRTSAFAREGEALCLELDGESVTFVEPRGDLFHKGREGSDDRLLAPISGQVVSIRVVPGDRVERGQCVAILEAMKMEHRVLAQVAGEVESVTAAEGDQVAARQVLGTLRTTTGNDDAKE
jgi:geranyl-CoA carboxylase alpha subunit